MAKFDIKAAYRILPIHPEDRFLFWYEMAGQNFIDLCLAFGLRSACKIFNNFADMLAWILKFWGFILFLIHYLDDFFLVFPPNSNECSNKLRTCKAICAELEVPLAEEKTLGHSTVITFLGIELDSVKFEAHLPVPKLVKAKSAVNKFLSLKSATKHKLLSLIGHLQHCCKVIAQARPFLRRLIHMSTIVQNLDHPIRVTRLAKDDLQWWNYLLRAIENAKLRELVAKGPKYREPNRVNWKATETMFLESIDLYAKNWSKREQVELKYLSEWKDQLKELVTDRISNLKGHFKSPKCKVLDQPDVKDTLHKLHANYVLVPADKAANNVIVVCKKYYIDTLVKELGINNINSNNPTYIPIDDSFETIIKSHNQFITSVGLEMSEEDQNLPYLYWTPTLHKSPHKHWFIAGSSKCTTKDLSCLLTKLLSTIKDGLVRYCNTKTSRNGVNNMWILKNSTSLLSSLDQLDVRTAKSVQAFDFSTLYTSIPHDLLKSRISNLVHNAFRKKDGSVRYTHIKLTRAKGYFTHDINGGGDNMFTADSICEMIEIFD